MTSNIASGGPIGRNSKRNSYDIPLEWPRRREGTRRRQKGGVRGSCGTKVWHGGKVSVHYPKERRYEGGNGGYGWFPRHFKTGIYATRLRRKQWLRRDDKSAGRLHPRLSRSRSDSFQPRSPLGPPSSLLSDVYRTSIPKTSR